MTTERSALRVMAPCKLNLFLEVRGRRDDGYHDIDTVLETISLRDELRVSSAHELEVHSDRADVPSGPENIAFRIVRAAEARLGRRLPARIEIKKELPPGSGLGAGSSDAVEALRAVLSLHDVRIPESDFLALAASVGSDTPFFVRGRVARCLGRGEHVLPVLARGLRHYVVVLGAGFASTPKVYAALLGDFGERSPEGLLEALARGEALTSDHLHNRLQPAAFRAYPILEDFEHRLFKSVGRRAHLSGSGSAFFFPVLSENDAMELRERLLADGFDARAATSGLPENEGSS